MAVAVMAWSHFVLAQGFVAPKGSWRWAELVPDRAVRAAPSADAPPHYAAKKEKAVDKNAMAAGSKTTTAKKEKLVVPGGTKKYGGQRG